MSTSAAHREQQVKNLRALQARAVVEPRPMIEPRVVVSAATPTDREKVAETARKVIAEHREVLLALSNR